MKVAITKIETGETRIHEDTYPYKIDSRFIWEEGNYSCDCNRNLFFERAGGNEPSHTSIIACGNDVLYSIEFLPQVAQEET